MGELRLEVAEASASSPPLCVGRWQGASVRIDDEHVLPVEFVVAADAAGRWELFSLRPGGAELNGRRVHRAFVTAGDVVSVAGRRLELHLPAGAAESTGLGSPLKVSLRWGNAILDERVLPAGAPVTVGPKGACRLESLEETTTVARAVDGQWVVALDGPWRVVDAGSGRPLLAAPGSGPAAPGAWALLPPGGARLESGGLSVVLSRASLLPLERSLTAPWWSSTDGQRTLIALLVAVFVLAVLRNPPVAGFAPDEAALAVRELVAQYRPPQRPAPEVKLERFRRSTADSTAEAGAAKVAGREGETGRPNASPSDARRAGPKTDDELVREHALLKMLSSNTTQRLLSGGALSAASALGRLNGPDVGVAAGKLGLGLRGEGRGGGGLSTSSVGVAALGTGSGLSKAAGAGRIGHGSGSDLGIDEPANVAGGLDREVIRRVVVSHRAQVVYCYEKRLLASSGIAGKLLVEFVIGADGHVVSARPSEDGLGDPEVGRCIVSRVRGWTFPPPKGGGVVVVTYPFLFKPVARGDQ